MHDGRVSFERSPDDYRVAEPGILRNVTHVRVSSSRVADAESLVSKCRTARFFSTIYVTTEHGGKKCTRTLRAFADQALSGGEEWDTSSKLGSRLRFACGSNTQSRDAHREEIRYSARARGRAKAEISDDETRQNPREIGRLCSIASRLAGSTGVFEFSIQRGTRK